MNPKKETIMKYYMKSFVWAALAASGMCGLQSCDNDDDDNLMQIPPQVQQAFSAQYPGMNVGEWDFEWGNYKAEFYYNGTVAEWNISLSAQADAWFTPEGNWLKTEYNVVNYFYNAQDQTVVPAIVRETIAREAGARRVDDVERVDIPAGDDYFEIEIDNEPEDILVKVDFGGNVIR